MKKTFIFLVLLLMLTACKPQNSGPILETPANDNISTKTTLPPTQEPTKPIPTATQTLTPTMEPTATSIPTETPVPTEVVNFDAVKIIGVDEYPGYASVIFEFPAISKLYYVKINNSPYNCQIPESTVDRLFCSGEGMRTGEYADVTFYADENFESEMITTKLYVPAVIPTPLPIGEPSTWCPARGTKISCETEHRVEFGEECWVQTCFDACGYYYSYHTCQLPPNNNFLPP
ncbi:MAG: hypothetical protein CL609_06435 [Anaerolineaceae bacterium]|nr:hypothetical protein [Anaerolineaceae bacterium]